LDCYWKLDGKPQGSLKSSDVKIVHSSFGEHLVQATSPDGFDEWRGVVSIGHSGQKAVEIKLKELWQVRIEREEAEKKRLSEADAERKRLLQAEAELKRLTEEKRGAEAEAAKMRAEEAEAEHKRLVAEAEQKRQLQIQRVMWKSPAGLLWSKMDNGEDLNWRQAQAYCANLSLAGQSRWRLPTIDELQRIYDPVGRGTYKAKGGIAINNGSYWSATREGAGKAWTFNFIGSRYPRLVEDRGGIRALCVRTPE
jgi:hypothetical protein